MADKWSGKRPEGGWTGLETPSRNGKNGRRVERDSRVGDDGEEGVIGIWGTEALDAVAWVDEVQVAVELPMGPPGPEGPEPTFAIDQVITGNPGGEADVNLEKDPQSGVWEFDFLIPTGPEGLAGEPGPPMDILGELGGVEELPVDATIGDAWLITNEDGSQDLWVYGSNGWQVLEGYRGVAGPPTYAWVDDDSPPPNPVEGQIWFRPSAMGYVPTALRVDGGLQFDQFGGHIWGEDNGDISFGIGDLGGVGAHIEQMRLTGTALNVRGLTMAYVNVLRVVDGELQFGEDRRNIRTVARLHALEPTVDTEVATKGYVDADRLDRDIRFVNISGDSMTGPLILPGNPVSATQAATKGYVDERVASGAGLSQAQADARYVNQGGDTMTGPLGVPSGSHNTHAVNLGQMNAAFGGANVHRVNNRRMSMGSAVVTAPSSGTAYFDVDYPIEYTVVVSNGHYAASPTSIRLNGFSGRTVTVINLPPGKGTRINWVAS